MPGFPPTTVPPLPLGVKEVPGGLEDLVRNPVEAGPQVVPVGRASVDDHGDRTVPVGGGAWDTRNAWCAWRG